ncbi:Uncharacterised protein [Legionella cincinnatiensis]|uniref:Uncharacterized protein n=2 Tax=Legionella cincinnatiensis TaxID=28085 RepID=A0A378IKE8_9GAMM|nr:hypothetical protein [Legionella cincinnatiensis]KTC83398.1 hypothetical protein Lcin_2085 [Legionella cincinnatiensis]STX35483.1 Uncharacterised protein [Legionella cincinnatiensis]
MSHDKIERPLETVKEDLEDSIESLKSKRPDLEKKLNKLVDKFVSMTKEQLIILNKRLEDFAKLHDALLISKKEKEWMIQIAPNLFKKADEQYKKIENKLLKSKKLDEIADPTWVELNEKFKGELDKIKNPTAQVKKEFLSHFGDKNLRKVAGDFFDDYKAFMAKLEEQKRQVIEIIERNGGTIDEAVLDAEINKQLKLVQAQVILAMSAAKAEEKATHLKLAGSALVGVSFALGGAGAGVAILGVTGTVVPVVGTAIGATVGLVAGGILGGVKGYHAYKEAKAMYQAQLAKTFKDPHHKFEKSVSMDVGIASIKTREAFAWLMKGPQEADFERMIYQYQLTNPMYDVMDPHEKELLEKDFRIRLSSEFAASRDAYFSMLHDIIRSSTADSALQAAAGLTVAPPFDTYSALDISTQFTSMCHTQIGAARAMGGLKSLPEFPIEDHISVRNSKDLAYEAATQLASNAESLATLAHQIALCTNLDEATRKEILEDIRQSLGDTIATYDEIAEKYKDVWELKPSLKEALMTGMFGDIEHMGEKDKPKKQNSKEHRSYSAAIDYMKDSRFHHEEYGFHQSQNKSGKKESKAKEAAELGDTILNVMIITGVEIFHGPVEIASPEVLHTEHTVGSSEFTAIGLGVGGALAGLALASGAGAYYLNAKAKGKAEELCIFGNISKRREKLHENLHDKVELAYLKEDRLHTLIDAPDTMIHLDRASKMDTLVSSKAKSGHEKHHIKGSGWSQSEVELPVTRGQKKYGEEALTKLNKSLKLLITEISDQMDFLPKAQQYSDKAYSDLMDSHFYSNIMKILKDISTSSRNDRLGLASEEAVIKSLIEKIGVINKIVEEFPDDLSNKEDYHLQKIDSMIGELEKLMKNYNKHSKRAAEGPRNIKAIAMDSERMDDLLRHLVKLVKGDFTTDPKIPPPQRESIRERKINEIIVAIKKIIDRQKGELPESTNIKLVKKVLELMGSNEIPEKIAEKLKAEPVIKQEMIERIIKKQKPDAEEEERLIPQM